MDALVTLEEVLRLIERSNGYEVGSLRIDRGEVWRRNDDGDLRSVCQVGGGTWLSFHAAELATRALIAAKGSPLSITMQELVWAELSERLDLVR